MKYKLLLIVGLLTFTSITWASTFAPSIGGGPDYITRAQGTYSACDLPIVFLPSIMTIPQIVIQSWETEPNNPYYNADGPILPQHDYYGYPDDDRDYWSLYLPTQSTINIDLLEMSAPGQLQLFYGTATDENRVASDIIPPYHIEHTGSAGLYYILIGTSSGHNREFRYVLRSQFPVGFHINETDALANSTTRHLAQWVGYNFEVDTEKWWPAEADFKLAELEVSSELSCKGSQSLKLTTELKTGTEDVYLHTSPTVYFDNGIPQGMSGPGPYDLTGARVSCYVYIPEELATEQPYEVHLNLFIKDKVFHNQYSESLYVSEEVTGNWQLLSLVVGEEGEGYIDADFDPQEVNALGVVINLEAWASMDFIGSLYIDECEIEYP